MDDAARLHIQGGAVVNGVSCMSCHAQGIIQSEDAVRPNVEARPSAFTASEVDLVRALYARPKSFGKLQRDDASRFADAVIQSGARSSDRDPIATLGQRFEANLTLQQAAAEVGLSSDQFLAGLEKSPALRRELGPLEGAGQTVPREVFLKSFAALVRALRRGTPASRSREP